MKQIPKMYGFGSGQVGAIGGCKDGGLYYAVVGHLVTLLYKELRRQY